MRYGGKGLEREVGVHQLLALGWVQLEVQAVGSEDQTVLGHLPEIRMTIHQAALPGVLQLLDAPSIAERRSLAREELLGQFDHRVDVIERPVSVKGQAFDLPQIASGYTTRRDGHLRSRAPRGAQSGT